MLSICIPIYNFNVDRLVKELLEQLSRTIHPFEIILMDDASDEVFRKLNMQLETENVRYIQLQENIGRSRIRNKLAEESRYPYLIFMDCDSALSTDHYIDNYLKICEPLTVCYGGRIYEEKVEEEFVLRWKYGVERECLPAHIRRKNPNYKFSTNNFLIHKSLFEQVRFNEDLKGYGHEDTFFGLELSSKGITIKHIDNPLIHIGLETAEEFLSKTENGVRNLAKVDALLNDLSPEHINHSELISLKKQLDKYHLSKVVISLTRLLKKRMKANLLGKNPSLKVFDLYKLGILYDTQNSGTDQSS